MTGTFYAALHYVEAYFCKYPPVSSIPYRENLEKRDSNIKRDARLSIVYNDYRELKTESEDARYRPWISPSQMDVQRIQKHLEAIRKIVIAALDIKACSFRRNHCANLRLNPSFCSQTHDTSPRPTHCECQQTAAARPPLQFANSASRKYERAAKAATASVTYAANGSRNMKQPVFEHRLVCALSRIRRTTITAYISR